MLQETRTLEKFGYEIKSLTRGSKRKVCIQCDYCKSEYEIPYKAYFKGREVIEKDACIKCKFDKRRDVSLKLYGVANSAQRPEVRKKISEKCEGFDQKRIDAMEKKYGVTNAMQSQELKDRQKESVQEKYGVDNVSQVPEIRAKAEQTNLEKFGNKQFLASEYGKEQKLEGVRKKYGVDNVFQSEEIKKKIRSTNMENLGVEMPTQSSEVMDKIRKTNLEKYGVEYVAQNDEIKEKIEETNIDRYGCKNPLQNEAIREKMYESNIEKYGVKYPTQTQEVQEKIRLTKIGKGLTKTFDGKDMKTIAIETNKAYSTLVVQARKYGLEDARLMSTKMTNIEYDMKLWLDQENVAYKTQFVIGKKRADFLLTDYNIIIEVDGLYWHSEIHRPDNYHIEKRQHYIDANYKPFFFREDELNDKFDIIKSVLNNAMNRSNRIFARKCLIVELTRDEAIKFFNENHLMGVGSGKVYGLKYNDNIVSAIMIKRLKDNDYEISRFCSTLNTQVIGGFSRLVKHFLRNNQLDSLTTFIDKRYGSGSYLTNLGFVFESCYPSFRWTNGNEIYHRLKYSGNSGYDNGFVKIWDCGQAKYVFRK